MFYYELEQKEKINSRIAVPLGILSLLISGAFYYVGNLSNVSEGIWRTAFFIIFGIYILAILCSIFLTIRAYYGYEYGYLPLPTEIEDFTQRTINYYDQHFDEFYIESGKTKECLITEDINQELYKLYKQATDNNMKLNNRKTRCLRALGWALVVSLVAGILSIGPFYLAQKAKQDKATKVELVNSGNKIFKGRYHHERR